MIKYILIPICVVLMTSFLTAQTSEGINYQAVLRDGNGAVIGNRNINIRFTILRTLTNTTVYREIQQGTTNEFGIFNAVVGKGTTLTGNFNDILWENAGLKLRVEIDPQGGNFFEQFGESDFQAVPFAFAAATASNLSSQARITTGQLLASGAQQGQILRWNGSAWIPSNETMSSTNVSVSARLSGNGTAGNPLDLARNGANNGQILRWNGTAWAPSNENTVNFAAGTGITINQTTISANSSEPLWNALQLRGRTVANIAPNTGQVLSFDGSAWSPTNLPGGFELPFNGTGGSLNVPAFRVVNNEGVGVESRGPIGLRAVATGPSFGSFALDIQGGIRVGGGNRPAFRVGGTGVITINSPLTNDNPSALIFVTQINPDPMNFPAPFPFYITYDFAAQRWVIVSDETRPLSYNVLVINQQ